MDTADFWIVFITTELLRAAAERAELGIAQGRACSPHQRVRGVLFGKIYQELWNALNSNDFPGPLFVHNNQCWLLETDEERRLLHEALRRRLNTRQNLHKRLQLLDLIEPAGNFKKRRYGLALARRRRLSRRHLRKHDVIS
jgi:hypothetical protein